MFVTFNTFNTGMVYIYPRHIPVPIKGTCMSFWLSTLKAIGFRGASHCLTQELLPDDIHIFLAEFPPLTFCQCMQLTGALGSRVSHLKSQYTFWVTSSNPLKHNTAHSNHVTSSKLVDTLICHNTMCRNVINL